MTKNNIMLLLQGQSLLKEIDSERDEYRAWVEVALQDDFKPAYPFRTEPYAMIGHSAYFNSCHESEAKFKIRTVYFLRDDIENNYDPCYDQVGEYIKLNSIDILISYLQDHGLQLDYFLPSSIVDDYPL